MPRPLVVAEGLTKQAGGRTLLEAWTFEVEAGERVAVVGPNGSGKSTLFRLMTEAETPDSGRITVSPHAPIAFFRQHADVKPGATARDVLAEAARLPPELEEELAALDARIADPALYESPEADAVLARYGEVQREIANARAANAPDPDNNPLLADLGFAAEDLERKFETLSGGQRTRLLLARTLAGADEDGLLLLDEPTNHLDVETIEWLEERLLSWRGTILFVAHDRAFLDNVATRVLAFDGASLRDVVGNYAEYERLRDQDAAHAAMRRERQEKELARQKAVIEQFKHQKRFNGQMASRLTALAKYRASLELEPDPILERTKLSVAFPETFKSSMDVVRIRGLGKKFGDRLLFYGLDLDVLKGDRMGLVGPNGAGKTTLLKMIVGREKRDVGTIEVPPGVKGAYYAQGAEQLQPERALKDEVVAARPGLAAEDVRALLGRFGFRNEYDPGRKVATLSGGERARLALLTTVLKPSNLLILDEPTNHLDLESRDALARALNAYDGTLLVVSHDRWFLDSVVHKIAVIGQRSAKVFVGDFTNARLQTMMGDAAGGKPTEYVVRKAFKDFESGVKHTVGTTLKLTDAELEGKRVYRTALAMGWMAAD